MNTEKAKEIKEHLEERLSHTMEWYKYCISCEETFVNIRKDVNSILKEVCNKFNLTELPFIVKLEQEDDVIVLKAVDKKLN